MKYTHPVYDVIFFQVHCPFVPILLFLFLMLNHCDSLICLVIAYSLLFWLWRDTLMLQANEKTGGYVNRLVVTCVRSGLNRPFRVLQKPERAPIRALRASSSGRFYF